MGPRMTRTNGSNTVSSASGATGGFSGFKSMLSRKATVSSRQRSGSEVASIRSARRQDDLFAPLSEDGEHDGVAAMQPRPATPQRLNSDRPPQLPRPTIGKVSTND
jgi:hypothetical protein